MLLVMAFMGYLPELTSSPQHYSSSYVINYIEKQGL